MRVAAAAQESTEVRTWARSAPILSPALDGVRRLYVPPPPTCLALPLEFMDIRCALSLSDSRRSEEAYARHHARPVEGRRAQHDGIGRAQD